MRKRIVIGVVVLAVVGVGGYVLSQPRKGTVEWHKREYLRSVEERWHERAQNTIRGFLGMERIFIWHPEDYDQQALHRRALVNLGYLAEAEFVVSNRTVDEVFAEANRLIRVDPRSKRVAREFWETTLPKTNKIAVVAQPEAIQMIIDAVRKADVPPENEKTYQSVPHP